MSEKKPDQQRISAVPPFGLRMLPSLRERLEVAANANKRSMNAEIVSRLERSFEDAGSGDKQAETDHELLITAASEGALRAVTEIVSILNKFRGDGTPANMQDVLADVLWGIEENRKANSPYVGTSRKKGISKKT